MSPIDILSISSYEEFLQLQKRVAEEESIKTFSFSKISFEDLEALFNIEDISDLTTSTHWAETHHSLEIESDVEEFLKTLLKKEGKYIHYYFEEDLKIKFIAPILNRVDFTVKPLQLKDFYESKILYKTDSFTLKGTADFVVSKGLKYAKKPFFFIQEFKKGLEGSNPEPQLLAELIAGVELNSWKSIKGAYIVGENWNFVILEKLGKDKYQYFVSRTFNSTNIEDLKQIYKNLLFVKYEIISIIEKENL